MKKVNPNNKKLKKNWILIQKITIPNKKINLRKTEKIIKIIPVLIIIMAKKMKNKILMNKNLLLIMETSLLI